MKLRELPQKMQMMLAPGDNIVKIVAARDGGTDHKLQDLRERIDNAPRLTVIRECGKMVQQQGQTRTRAFPLKNRVHGSRSNANQSAHGITPPRQLKIAPPKPLT
jgi:hypothetical protein